MPVATTATLGTQARASIAPVINQGLSHILQVLVKVQKGPEMLAMMWRYASSVSLIESGGCSQHGMSCGPFLSGDSSIIFKHSKIKKEPCSLMCV